LLRRLAADPQAQPIVVLENFFCTPREEVLAALPHGVRLIEGDVADPAAVAAAFEALETAGGGLTVFHLAAQPSAAIAVRDPQTTERSNLVGARVLLEAAQQHAARVVFGGSFRVYGDDLSGQTVSEDTPYGKVGDLSHLSKIYVEQLARMLGSPFVSVRLGVTYGLSPIMKTTPAFMTVPNLFCKRAAEGEPLLVLEDRPLAFIHVDDAAEALLAAARKPLEPSQPYQVVNAAPEVATIGQLARTVQRTVERRGATAVHIDGAASSEAGYTVSSRLDLTPRHRLADGLGDVFDFFLRSSVSAR
jgi:nucleoside-diphosphate-sugar epimerase